MKVKHIVMRFLFWAGIVIFQYWLLQSGVFALGDARYIFRPPQFYTLFQNIALLLGINLLIFALIRRKIFAVLLVTLCFTLFSSAGLAKIYFMDDPVYPSDLSLIRDAYEGIKPLFSWGNILLVLAGLGVLLSGIYTVDYLSKCKTLSRKGAWLFGGLALLLLGGAFAGTFPVKEKARFSGFGATRPYRLAGVPFCWLVHGTGILDIQSKAGYTQENIRLICERILKDYRAQSAMNVKPHIVLLVQESMIDPRPLKIPTTVDLLAHMRQYGKDSGMIHPISSSFGGASSQTDLEVMTGFSASLMLGNGDFAQNLPFKKPIPSLAKILHPQGYESHVIFPCPPTLFDYRNVITQIYGYQDFQEFDQIFPKALYPQLKGLHDSLDSVVYATTLNLLHQSDTPQLLYVQCLQNHAPHVLSKRNSPQVVADLAAAGLASDPFNAYLQGVYESDQMLAKFIEGLKQLKRPVIFMTFGDHVPPLPPDIRKKLGMELSEKQRAAPSKLRIEQVLPRRAVAGLYWSSDFKITPFSAYPAFFFVPGHLLKDLGLSHPFYSHFMDRLQSHFTAYLPEGVFITPDQTLRSRLDPEGDLLFRDYDLILYDLIYGDQFSLPLLFPEAVDGYSKPE